MSDEYREIWASFHRPGESLLRTGGSLLETQALFSGRALSHTPEGVSFFYCHDEKEQAMTQTGEFSAEDRLQFKPNAFNFCRASLRYIDDIKGRGVFVEEDIPPNTIMCLFSGKEVARLPESGSFARKDWPFRSENDQRALDDSQEELPLSDYAISCSVLDFDASQQEVGYHWRMLDPMADDEAIDDRSIEDGGAALRNMWNEHANLDFMDPGSVPIPDNVADLIAHKAKQLYSQLVATWTDLPTPPPGRFDGASYKFVADDASYTIPVISMNVNDRLEFICAHRDVHDKEYVVRKIVEAMNRGFDAKSHIKRERRIDLAKQAMRLSLPSSYPHMAPFINRPSATEQPNAVFVDPVDWIPPVTRMKPSANHAHLIQEARARDLTPDRLSYLQRPAVKATTLIKRGTEILVDYNRDS